MYLVHVRVQLVGQTTQSDWLKQVFHSQAGPEDMVRHLSVHPEDDGLLTVGFWIGAPSAVASEEAARAVAERALAAEPTLRHSLILGCSCALVPAVFDQMLRSPQDPGRNVRRTNAATGEP